MDRSHTYEHAILNAAWMVRHYGLQRTPTQRIRRQQAIQHLGLVLREALASTDDFEPILVAVITGLRPNDERPL